MSRSLKGLKLCLFGIISLAIVRSTAIAQVGLGFPALWKVPSFSEQPHELLRLVEEQGDILVDNFEYSDSPGNHGWYETEPPHAVYGSAYCYGCGNPRLGTTVLDFNIGSRVLDVYNPKSIFLFFTPYEELKMSHDLSTPPSSDPESSPVCLDYIDPNIHPIISFNVRIPLGLPQDNFKLDIIGETLGGDSVIVKIVPVKPPPEARLGPVNSIEGMYDMQAAVTGFDNDGLVVTVAVGTRLLDGSWHDVWVNFAEAVKAAIYVFDGINSEHKEDWYMAKTNRIMVSGQMFRVDNIIFRVYRDPEIMDVLHLFEMGPLCAEIYEPYRYLFIADYVSDSIIIHDAEGDEQEYSNINELMLNPDNFLIALDPNDPNDPVVKYWIDLGADPNLFGQEDPNLEDLFGRAFAVDLSLPIFADPNLRVGGSMAKCIINQGIMGWNAIVGGYGANGIQGFLLKPLPICPYDGMPTYLPACYSVLDVIKAYGKPYYSPGVVFWLEGALWNSGFTGWPNIAALDFVPQYYEDLIVTIEVRKGMRSSAITFPISIVNYPVANYPPVLQPDIEDKTFYIGELGEYHVNFIDPDCFIFCMSPVSVTSHIPGFPISEDFRTDMDGFHWGVTINDLASYQYGAWVENVINTDNGLISFIPKFEGSFETIITCEDERGATAFGEITISCVQPSAKMTGESFKNHPPFIIAGPESPIVVTAGEEVRLAAPDMRVYDPDGDELFASCNIGNIKQCTNNDFVWTFRTLFPGSYKASIVFYDLNNEYKILEFLIDVRPWWSY